MRHHNLESETDSAYLGGRGWRGNGTGSHAYSGADVHRKDSAIGFASGLCPV